MEHAEIGLPRDLGDGFELQRITDPSVLEEIYALRVIAWKGRGHIADTMTKWVDEFDSIALHFAVMEGAIPRAAARMTIHANIEEVPEAGVYTGLITDLPPPICSFNRCVVHPEYQNRGFACSLDIVRIAIARSLKCGSIVTNAGTLRRSTQFERLGFRYMGEGPEIDFILPDIPSLVHMLIL
jgi:hypothetical protein